MIRCENFAFLLVFFFTIAVANADEDFTSWGNNDPQEARDSEPFTSAPQPSETSTADSTTSTPADSSKTTTGEKKKAAPPKPKKPLLLPYDPSIRLRSPAHNPTLDKNLRVSLQSNFMKEADRWYTSGADVNSKDPQGRSLLYLAIIRHHLQGVEFLLLRRANVNIENMNGDTPLSAAVSSGFSHAVALLLERNASARHTGNGDDLLHIAIKKGYGQIADMLIDKGGVNVNKTYENGQSLLHMTAARGMVSTTIKLLEKGANPNATYNSGVTPLHEAAARGQRGTAIALLNHKADIKATTKKNWTPLHHAARFGKISMVELLLSRGASPNARNSDGKTPLALAKHLKHGSVIDILASRTSGGGGGGGRGGWFW
jgi:ankyrin repeat protein